MSDYKIGTSQKNINFYSMFGVCNVKLFAKGTIFFSTRDDSVIRKSTSRFIIDSVNSVSYNESELVSGSESTIDPNDFRIGEDVVLSNVSDESTVRCVVYDKSETSIFIRYYSDISISKDNYIDVLADDYLNEGQSIEFNTNNTPYLVMAAESEPTAIDISVIDRIMKS